MGVVMNQLPAITIKVIPHSEQRYPTVGDYWENPDGSWDFRISKCGNPDYEYLITQHEVREWFLAMKRGVKEPDIAAFDQLFEKETAQGLHNASEEPGDDPRCPVYLEHQFATAMEHLDACELGVDWGKYDDEIMFIWRGVALHDC